MSDGSSKTKKKILCAAVAANSLLLTGAVRLTAEQIVMAWESPEYRQNLTAEQLKNLPANPAGELQFPVANPHKLFEIAGTQYPGCDTQYPGCATQYPGCDTQYPGCATQYPGCDTQFDSCIA